MSFQQHLHLPCRKAFAQNVMELATCDPMYPLDIPISVGLSLVNARRWNEKISVASNCVIYQTWMRFVIVHSEHLTHAFQECRKHMKFHTTMRRSQKVGCYL